MKIICSIDLHALFSTKPHETREMLTSQEVLWHYGHFKSMHADLCQSLVHIYNMTNSFRIWPILCNYDHFQSITFKRMIGGRK